MTNYLDPTVYMLVMEAVDGGLSVHELKTKREYTRLTKTLREGRVDMGNFTCWYTYQSWLDRNKVKAAIRKFWKLKTAAANP